MGLHLTIGIGFNLRNYLNFFPSLTRYLVTQFDVLFLHSTALRLYFSHFELRPFEALHFVLQGKRTFVTLFADGTII